MPDQFEKLLNHAKQPATWLRILFMAGFVVILYLLLMVLMVLTAAQALFSIFTGADNHNLRRLGAALTEYMAQLLGFLTYNSEQRPFPFSPFPDVADVTGPVTAEKQTEAPETDAATQKKPASRNRRKSAAPASPAGSADDQKPDAPAASDTNDPAPDDTDSNRPGV